MDVIKFFLFRTTHELEVKIDEFLSNITQSGFLFAKCIGLYLESGVSEEFKSYKESVIQLESRNDTLRREIENQLYAQMILPDSRSDILKLIEGCDQIINKYETNLILLAVEKPKIPKELRKAMTELLHITLDCVESLLEAVRLFFDNTTCSDKISKVLFLEEQADATALELKKICFENLKLPLARQLQLKAFIYSIEKISDIAEDIADNLSIMAVKHSL